MNAELKKIVADTLGLSEAQITEDAAMETFTEWDSVAHINIVLSLESRYGLSFSPDEVLELGSVKKIQEVLRHHGAAI